MLQRVGGLTLIELLVSLALLTLVLGGMVTVYQGNTLLIKNAEQLSRAQQHASAGLHALEIAVRTQLFEAPQVKEQFAAYSKHVSSDQQEQGRYTITRTIQRAPHSPPETLLELTVVVTWQNKDMRPRQLAYHRYLSCVRVEQDVKTGVCPQADAQEG